MDESKLIDSYYSRFIKIRHCSHLFYTSKTGKFYQNYIPDGIYYNIIDPFFNDWKMANYIDNKCYYSKIFSGIPQPKILGYRLNGYWYDGFGNLSSQKMICEQIINSSEEFFIKRATGSWGGLGVFYFNPKEHDLDKLENLVKDIKGDLVIQFGIKQSSILSAINKDSVNTIRLLSMLKKDGSVKIYSGVLRMGIKGAKVDNATSGGISVGIEDNGRLKSVAFSNRGEKYEEHPTSHVKFDDFIIPNYENMKNLVIKLAPHLPHFRLISWDLAVDEYDEPILIEANLCDGELDFHQLNNGPIFGDDTEEILTEVFLNINK